MRSVATTKLSSKGQVVIPEEIRVRLGLKTGAEFVVVGERDVEHGERFRRHVAGEIEAREIEPRRAPLLHRRHGRGVNQIGLAFIELGVAIEAPELGVESHGAE